MFELLSTLIFAGIAIFIAIRLYSTLGRREGHMEAPPASDPNARPSLSDVPQSHLRPAFEGRAAAGLEAIAAVDPGFDPESFTSGARAAYTMIVEAFAKGDLAALRPLLADKVYQRYADAIAARNERKQSVRTEIERIKAAEISEASHEGHIARVKVSFEAEIATETLGENGERVSGDLGTLNTVRENWVFERRTDNANPNWVLTGVAAV
ncbi:Tim44/TimA family putative adaptor protein [Maricaulis salignorans]|uniref:Predicted lipid-binding transport protein, Tim44 family n=1 Tax=Maricaulis salignorans TaxID=144026 RepID=A0A1G9R7U7_9PROT|nr:Tim44/TimA family putative adaptor protein [Maricaulis salignorans]SDM18505.1 Predicted lipid-binding transport protein, Tim44 family [Maricaulis salignorans]